MTEQELRALVRTAIARVHVTAPLEPSHPSHLSHLSHPSHLTLAVLSGADIEGPCIIEPAVMCNHCGYCKSMGH
jgi:hypothetical protein